MNYIVWISFFNVIAAVIQFFLIYNMVTMTKELELHHLLHKGFVVEIQPKEDDADKTRK